MSLHEEALETVLFSGGGPHKLSELLELFYKEDEKSLILAMTNFDSLSVKYIGENPKLSGLKTLSLELSNIHSDDLKFLLSSPNLEHLETLNLRSLNCSSGVPSEALCNLKLKNLRKLDIEGFKLSKDDWKLFAKNENFQSLKSLGIADCFLLNKGVKNIAKSENFKNLEHLNFGSCNTDSVEMEAFCESPNFPNLKDLRLAGSKLTNKALRNLFTNENFKSLEKLNLRWAFLGEKLTPDMRDCRVAFKGLKKLLIGLNFFKADSLQTFLEIFSSVALEHLDLTGNPLEADSIKALVDSKMLESVKFLNFRSISLTNEDIKLLAQANLSNLETLIMPLANISDDGLKEFLSSQPFPNLKHFDISEANVTWEDFNLDLSETMPKIEYFIVPDNDKAKEKLPERFKEIIKKYSKRFDDEEQDMF